MAAQILVLGGSGYVGGRLVPELLSKGHEVRCLTRSSDGFRGVPWADDVEIVEGDLSDPTSLDDAFADVEQVVYLVHSLNDDDFARKELESATNTRLAADRAGVHHIVYLGGLGDDDTALSAHLQSRHDVGSTLADGDVAVTELRAAVILGAGSASFEMVRSLTDVLPVMTAPRWVTKTRLQPIAIADVLTYLCAALETAPPARRDHRIVEIGAPGAMTYADLIRIYADVAGLKRLIIGVPVLSPGFSTHWVNLVTPLPKNLAATLIDSLMHDVVVTDDSARALSPHEPMSARLAVQMALSQIDDLDIPTHWTGRADNELSAQPKPWDPDWSGGTVYEDRRVVTTSADPDVVQRTVQGIGGRRGWYGFGPLWALRGFADKIIGGVGMRRGRRHPDEIQAGEALDFWRVDAVEEDTFRLSAEMKMPGAAWLEWTTAVVDGTTEVTQRARYVPKGLLGRAYWVVLIPFHVAIFPIMLRRIVRAAEAAASDAPTVPDESAR